MYTYQYKKETKTNPKSDLCVFMYIIGGFFVVIAHHVACDCGWLRVYSGSLDMDNVIML